jgi:hypothetical protein
MCLGDCKINECNCQLRNVQANLFGADGRIKLTFANAMAIYTLISPIPSAFSLLSLIQASGDLFSLVLANAVIGMVSGLINIFALDLTIGQEKLSSRCEFCMFLYETLFLFVTVALSSAILNKGDSPPFIWFCQIVIILVLDVCLIYKIFRTIAIFGVRSGKRIYECLCCKWMASCRKCIDSPL